MAEEAEQPRTDNTGVSSTARGKLPPPCSDIGATDACAEEGCKSQPSGPIGLCVISPAKPES